MNKKYILIFKPKLARNLLRNGFNIVDIKADKNNPDRTIFVFEKTRELLEMMHKLS
ncbi:DUF5659 domain-containing protein [Anoxybacillus flavithermus]|uniref:DUF5659 domain-containing protein n=1 Tax=Anoxybacillus flavithermus TaxID=33934 RepID=A0A178TLS7_9BACL|nr:DUF5659 domain-containing protein [Anoxybacillus flavithermus]OAO82598.1 hypothetical protein TAF16_0218 [Anoxybacillus flavithermus]